MKITKRQLRQIIKEERANALQEQSRGLDEVGTLAQSMFTAYNNIAAAADDTEGILSLDLTTQVEELLETLEKLSEEISARSVS